MIGQSPPLQHFTANCAPGYIVILAQWDSFGPILVTSPLPWLCLSNTSENSKETTGSDHLSVLPIVEPYDRSAKEEPFLQQQLANTGPTIPPKSSIWISAQDGSQKLLYSGITNNYECNVYPPYSPFSTNLLQKLFEPLIRFFGTPCAFSREKITFKPSLARNCPLALPVFSLINTSFWAGLPVNRKRAHKTGSRTYILCA